MLLPDNIHPEHSIYFNGSIVLKELLLQNDQAIFDLYEKIKCINDMSFSTFVLSLHWLYLADIAKINEKGRIKLCSLNI